MRRINPAGRLRLLEGLLAETAAFLPPATSGPKRRLRARPALAAAKPIQINGGWQARTGMLGFVRKLRVVAINLVAFCALAGVIELYYRATHPEQRDELNDTDGIWSRFYPYTMFMAAPGGYLHWENRFTHQVYESSIRTNSLGFNDRHEFDYTKPYQKAPGERVVLFTGGSAGWGVGSTSTEASIAGRMQHYLNVLQQDHKYTVINLAMGSWIAYQEYLALDLWGTSFEPDWIVVMDGFNDAGAGCLFSQGVGAPMYFAVVKAYVDGYLYSTQRPVFYRGWLENELIKYSVAYRAITGKQYVSDTELFDEANTEANPVRRVIIPTKIGEARGMLAFYVKSIRGMLKLFPDAGYILSTQPTVNQFTGDFADIYQFPRGSEDRRAAIGKLEQGLEGYLALHENEPCGYRTHQPAQTYILTNGAIQLERLADEMQARGRRVEYHNTGLLFADGRPERMPYFMDPVHLMDKGNDVLGKFYAERILAGSIAKH
jgi:hypothetical protein